MKMKLINTIVIMMLSNILFAQTSKELSAISAFMYNTKGKVIEQHYYTVSSGQEEGPQKTYTFYNNNDKVKEQVVLNTFGDTAQKTVYQYQESKITVISYAYYGSQVTPTSKSVYNGVKESEEYDQQFFNFMFDGGMTMFLCDSFKMYVWESDDWRLNMKGYFTFNNYNNPSKVLTTILMNQTALDLQMDFSYDNKQNCTQVKTSVIVGLLPLSLMKVDQKYDKNSNLIEMHTYPEINPLLQEVIGDEFDEFLTESKIYYYYNTHNDISTIKYYTYDKVSSRFYETSSDEYVYKSMTINSEVKYVVDTIYQYIGPVTNITDQKQTLTGVFFFPNPVKDKIIVQGVESVSTLAIYDINGKQIHTQSIKPDDISVSVQSFARGMYIMKIINQKGVYFSKFMKE
ncbi:MAG: hypothetical protein BWY27_00496 [Bacteroidetes bacterium ADurb.Bin234]|nr:MAG: hypothetical protein BWY27_00496 [Bacteroidetes bacterium ADurb.Bin234]